MPTATDLHPALNDGFSHDGHAVAEVRTGVGDQTELLILGHVDPERAQAAFDAYTMHTQGWPLSEEYPDSWRIEHGWAVTDFDEEDEPVVRILAERSPDGYAVTRWTDS